jgi:hypothetical protein
VARSRWCQRLAASRSGRFPRQIGGSCRRFSAHCSLFCIPSIKFVRNQRSIYPAGTGKAVIFRSMPANSHRVSWLSATSNQ